jgi:hypothetical protein
MDLVQLVVVALRGYVPQNRYVQRKNVVQGIFFLNKKQWNRACLIIGEAISCEAEQRRSESNDIHRKLSR